MESAAEIIAEDVMEEEPVTVGTDLSISQIKARMEKNQVRSIPVVNDGKLKGVVGYRDLIRHIQFNPGQTKVEKVMHQPPEFEKDDTLVDLADLRINSGKKMLVNTRNDELEGVITDRDFLDALIETKEVQDVSTRNLAPIDLHRVFEEDSIEKARHVMLDNNISRLPVLDSDGKLTGILRSTDLLKMLVPRESQDSGGTSGGSLEDTQIAGGSEKEQMSKIPVNEIMDRTPPTIDGHIDTGEALDEMRGRGVTELFVMDNGYPETIITVKDVVEHIENLSASETVLVSLTGLELPEEKAALHNKIEQQLKGGLGRKLDNPEELSVHVKKADTDGEKHRYEMNVSLYSELEDINITEEGWEMLDVMDSALSNLDEIVRRKKEKQQDQWRQG